MNRERALDELPDVYARALRLRDQGQPPHVIAAALGVPEQAVGPLLRLGEAKLARLLAQSPDSPGGGQPG